MDGQAPFLQQNRQFNPLLFPPSWTQQHPSCHNYQNPFTNQSPDVYRNNSILPQQPMISPQQPFVPVGSVNNISLFQQQQQHVFIATAYQQQYNNRYFQQQKLLSECNNNSAPSQHVIPHTSPQNNASCQTTRDTSTCSNVNDSKYFKETKALIQTWLDAVAEEERTIDSEMAEFYRIHPNIYNDETNKWTDKKEKFQEKVLLVNKKKTLLLQKLNEIEFTARTQEGKNYTNVKSPTLEAILSLTPPATPATNSDINSCFDLEKIQLEREFSKTSIKQCEKSDQHALQTNSIIDLTAEEEERIERHIENFIGNEFHLSAEPVALPDIGVEVGTNVTLQSGNFNDIVRNEIQRSNEIQARIVKKENVDSVVLNDTKADFPSTSTVKKSTPSTTTHTKADFPSNSTVKKSTSPTKTQSSTPTITNDISADTNFQTHLTINNSEESVDEIHSVDIQKPTESKCTVKITTSRNIDNNNTSTVLRNSPTRNGQHAKMRHKRKSDELSFARNNSLSSEVTQTITPLYAQAKLKRTIVDYVSSSDEIEASSQSTLSSSTTTISSTPSDELERDCRRANTFKKKSINRSYNQLIDEGMRSIQRKQKKLQKEKAKQQTKSIRKAIRTASTETSNSMAPMKTPKKFAGKNDKVNHSNIHTVDLSKKLFPENTCKENKKKASSTKLSHKKPVQADLPLYKLGEKRKPKPLTATRSKWLYKENNLMQSQIKTTTGDRKGCSGDNFMSIFEEFYQDE